MLRVIWRYMYMYELLWKLIYMYNAQPAAVGHAKNGQRRGNLQYKWVVLKHRIEGNTIVNHLSENKCRPFYTEIMAGKEQFMSTACRNISACRLMQCTVQGLTQQRIFLDFLHKRSHAISNRNCSPVIVVRWGSWDIWSSSEVDGR